MLFQVEVFQTMGDTAPLLHKDLRFYRYRHLTFPLFKDGSNLMDELSFVYYYHSKPINQHLHLLTTTIMFFFVFSALNLIPVESRHFPILTIVIPIFYDFLRVSPSLSGDDVGLPLHRYSNGFLLLQRVYIGVLIDKNLLANVYSDCYSVSYLPRAISRYL